MSAEALVRALADYRRTITDTDQVKAIDLHQAQQMLRDPAPLLAALAEAGVLREWTTDSPLGPQHRYTTDWTEVQP